MRVAIIENMEMTHHGQVGVALNEAAVQIDVYRPWRDGILPEAADHDALVSFGGAQAALDDGDYPYLPRLADLMATKAALNHAVLGICLGSQVLARGLGARNLIGGHVEFGWVPLHLTQAAATDAVLGQLPAEFASFEWHSDHFTLPPGSVHLAKTATAPVQCFRAHRAAYGMQFHFEANRAVVADWTRSFPEAAEALLPGWGQRHAARAATEGVAADAFGLTIARNWVALI